MAKKKIINDLLKGAIYVNEGNGLIYSYDIYHTDDGETILRYVENGLWTEDVVGSMAGAIEDDGNNVTICIGDEEMSLDYAQMEILTALIMACNDTEMELREHRVITSLKPSK